MKNRSSARPVVESLETRRLMAVTTEIKDHQLKIFADDAGTTVDAQVFIDNKLRVTIDGGTPVQYSTKNIHTVKFFGGAGNDVFRAISTPDDPTTNKDERRKFKLRTRLRGGDGDDYLSDGYRGNAMNGGNGNDTIYGGGGDDTIIAGAGDDVVFGGPSPDDISNSDGKDYIFAGSGNDIADGGNDKDVIYGQDGNDSLLGGERRDALYGNHQIDTLDGGEGKDILWTGGQVGDVIDDKKDTNDSHFKELPNFPVYIQRIINSVVPENMRADANS